MKLGTLTLAIISLLAATGIKAKADLYQGDTFQLSINASPADESSFEDINPTIGPFTVGDGTPVNLGASLFDSEVDLVLTVTEDVISPTNSLITLQLVGEDQNGNLANPIGDGSLAANANPFTIIWVDLGIFNGGTDGLDITDPTVPSNYVVNGAFVGITNTAGEEAGIGNPTLFNDSPDTLVTSVGFNLAGDAATADLSTVFGTQFFPTSGEFAGWIVQFDVSAVPEPTAATVLAFGMFGLVSFRRKSICH